MSRYDEPSVTRARETIFEALRFLSPTVGKEAHFRLPTKKCMYNRSHHMFHNIYFGAATMEGHGLYALAAAALLVLSLINTFFLHFEDA